MRPGQLLARLLGRGDDDGLSWRDNEPPRASVVLDYLGDAWQRQSDGKWHRAEQRNGYNARRTGWADLNTARGPIVVIHRGAS